VLAFIDTPPRAPAPPSPDDLDALAERYAEAFGRAEPATLLTALGAHLRMVADALSLDPPTGTRQRLLRNRLRIGIIAGQLSEDIENPMAARAHYMQATDDAYEVDDHTAAAVAHGYGARLAVHERQPLAALRHLDRSAELATRDSAVRSWLAGIEAAAHAMLGHHAAAEDARGREEALGRAAGGTVVWFAGGTASRLPTAS
jgi:hypothetical protein